jgi:hypothetical protein
MKEQPYITQKSISQLDKSKKEWIKYFNQAKIKFVNIEEEYDIDYIDTLMPDFYFPEIRFDNGKTSEGFFASLNYNPIFIDLKQQYEVPFYTMDLLNPINKEIKYIDFLIKNRKPILFLNTSVKFTPTTVLNFEGGETYTAALGIPFAYLMKESYGNIWYAAGDENFTKDYLNLQPRKK